MMRPRARVSARQASRFYRKGGTIVTNGYVGAQFRGRSATASPAQQRALSPDAHDDQGAPRDVLPRPRGTERPRRTRPNEAAHRCTGGRLRYGQRFATAEPVFGNLRFNKRLDRFTLRGKAKVEGQWKLFCLVHNIEKLAHHGYAQ